MSRKIGFRYVTEADTWGLEIAIGKHWATLRDLSVVAFSRHLFGIWTSVQVIRTSHIDRDFGKRRFRMRSTGVGGKKVGNVVTNATRLSRPVRTFSSLRLSNSLGLLRQALPDCLHPPMPSWSPMPPTAAQSRRITALSGCGRRAGDVSGIAPSAGPHDSEVRGRRVSVIP